MDHAEVCRIVGELYLSSRARIAEATARADAAERGKAELLALLNERVGEAKGSDR